MILYLKTLALALLIFVVLGFLGPMLVSAASTEATLLGFTIIFVLFIPTVYLLARNIYKEIMHQKEENTTNEND